MQQIHIIIFIIQGFLISRLVLKGNLVSYLLFKLLKHKAISLKRLLLIVMTVTTLLSSLISNVATVILLLPFLKKLDQIFQKFYPKQYLLLMTIFPISIAYAANIGGISSITATPTNIFILTFLEWHQIHLPYIFSFTGWLLWGIPFSILLMFFSWLFLQFVILKQSKPYTDMNNIFHKDETKRLPIDNITIKIIIAYLCIIFIISTGMNYLPHLKFGWIFLSIFSFVLSLVYTFLIPIKINSTEKKTLLQIKDCFSGLPLSAFIFLIIMISIVGIGYLFKFHLILDTLITPYYQIIQQQPFIFLILCALFVSFGTEILLNSSILLAMFSILGTLYVTHQISEDLLLIASLTITLSATCAFISPIATGSNSFAFGMIPKIKQQWKIFVPIGILTNLFTSMIIACFCYYLIPRLL